MIKMLAIDIPVVSTTHGDISEVAESEFTHLLTPEYNVAKHGNMHSRVASR